MAERFRKIAVVGMGLMGGSLGLGLRALGGITVSGYARRARTRELAIELGAADRMSDRVEEVVDGAELVVLCVPVLVMRDMVEACRDSLAPGCIVTDVGSTKAVLSDELVSALAGAGQFVGSHPLAGSERTGLESARADLYRDALVFVTPPETTDPEAVMRVRSFWESLGARVLEMDPRSHDRAMACTSHLPHLAAAAVVKTVFRKDDPDMAPLCGTGFRDTTRVASGSEDVWHDIVKTNREFVSQELAALGKEIYRLSTLLERGDFDAIRVYLADARAKRNRAGCEDGESQTP